MDDLLIEFTVWRMQKRKHSVGIVTLDSFKPIKKNYDLITCIDVLEHLINPLEMLTQFRDHAKYLYITALKPADISQHLNMWNKDRIIDIMKAIGWKPIWLAADEGRGFFEND
jgi:2-polyprenyl-3-methyl-5-hydroxy-6-metoxy-1,4-benzoquinol methylase